VEYHYDSILEKLNLQTLHIRRRHFDALFLINAFCGTKYCPSVMETVSIRVPTWLTDGGEVVSLKRRPPFTPRKIPGTSFLLEAESTPGPQCG
jgi:hypothetical protein